MDVRVRVIIRYQGNSVSTTALVSSGYESEEPEIHIPLARRLDFVSELGLEHFVYGGN